MADPKDNTSFFRKVVKFVANPTTEWAEIGTPAEEVREADFAKTELKAMIERKRRNDFVRKREFDLLRRVRREGLSGEQLAALGGSSRLDDSEGRMPPEVGARQEIGVKAKIDEIEQQMVGDAYPARRRATSFYNAPTQPAALSAEEAAAQAAAPQPKATAPREAAAPAGSTAVMSPGLSPLSPLALNSAVEGFSDPFGVEVNAVQHDPELDEPVIAFANADFDQCEQALASLTGSGGPRAGDAETWLVLFDLYRAIGQQSKFESLANEYAQQFGWSAPQWFSMPRMVAEASRDERPSSDVPADAPVGWVCPALLDSDAVARLASQSLQMPLPWVFDWSALKSVDAEASARLSELFRGWIRHRLTMRWLGGERLFAVLGEATPTGVRDVDPAHWQLRLDSLRMANRPDQFDEAAIDYCVTYEVSPPSWEPAQCEVRIVHSNGTGHTTSSQLSVISEVSTSFMESQHAEPGGTVQVASLELSGQLVGDISATLKKLEAKLGESSMIQISCARLIRVDFIAAGDLLNWVLARRNENRSVVFLDAQRLVALFFGAMGINEHAQIKVRTV